MLHPRNSCVGAEIKKTIYDEKWEKIFSNSLRFLFVQFLQCVYIHTVNSERSLKSNLKWVSIVVRLFLLTLHRLYEFFLSLLFFYFHKKKIYSSFSSHYWRCVPFYIYYNNNCKCPIFSLRYFVHKNL